MYRNGSDYSEKQDLMNSILTQKITEFKVYYDEIKRENPESRFILIVGRSPPPFEELLETKSSHRGFFNEALGPIPEDTHIFYMDSFTVGTNFLGAAQLAIKELYDTKPISEFPLFIGSITYKDYVDFHNVFDAIIFDGGVCYNMALTLIEIQVMIQYLHNSSSYLLIDSDSDNCEKDYGITKTIPIYDKEPFEYYNPEFKNNPLKVTATGKAKEILFEGENPIFSQLLQEFDNGDALEDFLNSKEISKTHYYNINIIKRKDMATKQDKFIAMLSIFPKKIIRTEVIKTNSEFCLPSSRGANTTPTKFEELRMKLIEWLNINGFEGRYELIQGARNVFYIKIQKEVGKLGGRRKKKKTKRRKTKKRKGSKKRKYKK
jgi:hypothetical protein